MHFTLFESNVSQVLSALWQDMYIYQDESQWMSYTICGDVGKRSVTFDWRISKYQQVPEFYRFSATFYEEKPGRILVRYIEISDKGAGATVGIEGTKNRKSEWSMRNERSKITDMVLAVSSTYSQKQPKITSGLAIVWDPATLSWGTTS